MRRMGVREFRDAVTTVTEPVEIVKWNKTVGYFYPGDQGPHQMVRGVVAQDGPWDDPVTVAPKTPQGAPERFTTIGFKPVPKTARGKTK